MTPSSPREALPLSVVIPLFNRPEQIVDAVRSVEAQEGFSVERILVVDDASTDRSADVAEELDCTVVRLATNGGAAIARNAGLARVTSDWVCFLDSDDVWLPGLLKTLWPRTADHVLVSGAGLLQAGGRVLSVVGTPHRPGQELRGPADILVPTNPIVTSATIVSTAAVRAVGGFDAGLRYSEDLDLWLRVLERGPGWCDAAPCITYHRGAGSKSQVHGLVEAARADIVNRYAGHAWCRASDRERYLGGVYWQGARSAARSRQPIAAAAHLARAVSRPARAWGLAGSILHNQRLRRRVSEL